MRSNGRFRFMSVILLGALVAVVALPAGAAETAGLGVEVTLEPLLNHEGGFTCTATIVHLATQDVLAAPTLRFLRGEKGAVTSEMLDGAVVRFSIEVDDAGERMTYLAEYLRDDKLLSAQKATLNLDLGPGESPEK